MKIAVECKSPLLQKSLELFLEKYLSSTKKCDIVVRDQECLNDDRCFYIGSGENVDLLKPFSKSQLILALESRYKELGGSESEEEPYSHTECMDFSILEKRIELLTQEYQSNIIRAVKAFYEK
ncbi:hypothetical protein [Sulfurimonas sp.]|jgi:hypothetical protein|uniref:hypothetical protein n=1 Tax=Sulfurimonas sp. TaxID=2022749 RepID=UPI0025EBF4D5|nr:hypothetical protein [Sulfurimonas sp.]MBT5933855.1 hypothetical protein [Sulfurimonas sp.]